MRLIKVEDSGFTLTKEYAKGDNIPPYAILSHTWGDKDDEIYMRDIQDNKFKQKAAYRKLLFCSTRAASDGLQHFWIDTCCIDQANTVELTRAINSMFRWYKNAEKCYVYLSDVPRTNTPIVTSSFVSRPRTWEPAFRASRWFTRGWTLQELLAPQIVEFISSDGVKLGDKVSLEDEIHQITGIDHNALRGSDLSEFSFEKRMSWVEGRQTKEEEDIVYSLLGIFGVFLPLIYGEGRDHAHIRLREQIEKLPTTGSQGASSIVSAKSWTTTTSGASTPATVRSWTQSANNSQKSSVVICDKCNEPGHYANDVHCYKCGKYGHYANQAHCYTCGEFGHFAAEHRSKPKASNTCSKCGEYGHTAQDVHCYRCGVYGHYIRDCPEEQGGEEEDDDDEDSEGYSSGDSDDY
ncbi:heterokaryon incompatibility protein-domain-containing protein [Nemania sp. FL0031]|nr:heterokaryon incompatibility protein-domain-containing protein [Nemania sp. FL0031]